MVVVFVQVGRLEGEIDGFAVDFRAGVAVGDEVPKQVFERTFLVADDGSREHGLCPLGQLENLADHILGALFADLLARDRVVLGADAGVQ